MTWWQILLVWLASSIPVGVLAGRRLARLGEGYREYRP